MLTFEVSALLKKAVGDSETIELNEKIDNFNEKFKIVSPLMGLLTLTRIDEGILVQFNGQISVELACARCAENYKIDFPLNFMQDYWEQGKEVVDSESPRIPDDFKLDLLPRFQQEILIQVPIKPLCSLLCKGICPQCGQNLNIKQCPCPKDKQPPKSPFDKLKEFKK
jgi:uncharacterized protein